MTGMQEKSSAIQSIAASKNFWCKGDMRANIEKFFSHLHFRATCVFPVPC
jgi:hypothetical protein